MTKAKKPFNIPKKPEVFEINNRKFVLRQGGYNARELEKIQNFQENIFATGKQVTARFSADEFAEFLSIILLPEDGKEVPEDFDYALADEDTQMAIYKAFFLERLGMRMDYINNSLRN